jgi:hypothetical protein
MGRSTHCHLRHRRVDYLQLVDLRGYRMAVRLMFVALLMVLGLVMSLLYRSITANRLVETYQASVTSVTALNPQALTVGYEVTNKSKTAGSPSCVISASSPGSNVGGFKGSTQHLGL